MSTSAQNRLCRHQSHVSLVLTGMSVLAALPNTQAIAQTLFPIGTLMIQGVMSGPVTVYSAGVSYEVEDGDSSGGAPTGKIKFSLFTLTKRVDVSSPRLLVSAASGETFQSARIELFGVDGTPVTSYDLEEIRVLSATVKDALDAGAPALIESVSLSYSRIRQMVPSSDGTAPVVGCWDNVQNTAC